LASVRNLFGALVALVVISATPSRSYAQSSRARFKLEAVQGILAVQALDGWLLYGRRNQNPIANELVHPDGTPTRPWYYLIPTKGQPVMLVHASESASFKHVPGRKIEYTGHRNLRAGLRKVLRGMHRVAMEYAPKSNIPSLTRVDAGTIRHVRSYGVKIRSSAQLVQFTKSIWRPAGRISHYIAAHHLDMLRQDALAFVKKRLAAGNSVTEYEVQQRIMRGYKVRGLTGPAATVASGENTADPRYVPSATKSRTIAKGDLLLLDLAAKLAGAKRSIYAEVSWMAYVGAKVPERYTKMFKVVAGARDAAIAFITKRVKRRRAIKGYQADQVARSFIGKAGHAAAFIQRTGHSIDTDIDGDGANLDDFETHDTRNLVVGAGFSVEPGVYFKNQYGLRSGANVHLARGTVEVTTRLQHAITPLLVK